MKRQEFQDDESRRDLIELVRDGLAGHRLGQRKNALVLLDAGKSASEVAGYLLLTVDAARTIMLLMGIEAMSPGKRLIRVFLDNAPYHHAKLVQAWLARPGCRIKLHFIPASCPHLNPIERLWGLMHRHTTHNKCYASFREFSITMLDFLRRDVPRNWSTWCDAVTDNFRIINPTKYRILT